MDKALITKLITEKVTIDSNGCWIWPGNPGKARYPRVRFGPKMTSPHRLAAHAWHDMPLDSPLSVCHKCDVPACCNPDHLFLGTHRENMADREAKGRSARPRGSAHWKSRLSESDVRAIVEAMFSGTHNQKELGKMFGVGWTTIAAIKRGDNWGHLFDDETRERLSALDLRTHGEKDAQAKLTSAQVSEMKRLMREGKSNVELAERFGVGDSQVSRIKSGKRWAHIA